MTLKIDTKDQKQVVVSLWTAEQIDQMSESNQFGSQVILPLVLKMLEKNHLGWRDLTQIQLETGPGSFTGLRVGAAIANALGFSLGVKVNGKTGETDLRYS